jgi:hypothetical protein
MRLSHLVNLSLIGLGAAASLRSLRRRHAWEQANRQASIVLDYDDALAVATRAGLPLADFLCRARERGATHISLPELTLDRLLRAGRLVPVVPARSQQLPGSTGQWHYLASSEPALLEHLAAELDARLPSCEPQLLPRSASRGAGPAVAHTLAVRGHLPAISEIGLGFDAGAAAEILSAGLGLAPRPVSFSWPEPPLVERTLAQVAGLGASLVVFDGDLILGHEMHLDTTVECLLRHRLAFAYFCETRHQKGDWFIAKRLAPHGQVLLAHYLTPAAMVPEDYHSAAHHWGMLARTRGIRLCYVNVFRRIHATAPLECLHYLDHIRGELESLGLRLAGPAARGPLPLPAPGRAALALAGLASAGAGSMALSRALRLPEPAALGLSALAAAGAAALPFADRPRGALEAAYPPSYAPKLLALAAASAAPAAAALSRDSASAMLVQAGTAAALAGLTTGADYQMRIEAYRSLNLDLALPLAGVLAHGLDDSRLRHLALAGLLVAWRGLRAITPDLLGELDRDLPAGHTHHLSAAQRAIGDALLAIGPRPGRKWAGLGLAAWLAAGAVRRLGRNDLALALNLLAALGNAMGLAAWRVPERPLAQSLPALLRGGSVLRLPAPPAHTHG